MEEEEEITDSEEEQVILEEVSRKKRRVIRPPKRVVSPPPVVAETAPSSTAEGNASPATAIDAEQPQYAGALVPLPVSTRAERGLFRWPCKFVAGLVHPFMCLAGRAK